MGILYPMMPINGRRALKARWSRQLLDVLGVRLQFAGTPPAGGFLVANHISWLDVYAINALVPTSFVAKAEVRAWPLIGWLSQNTETIFMERGSRAAAMRAQTRLADALRRRSAVGVFPEGTTSSGEAVLPFHSALFQPAIDAGTPVLPLSLRYTGRDGQASAAPVYIGETSLWQSLLAIAGADGLTVHIEFLPALDPVTDGMNRRRLALQAHQHIGSRLARHRLDGEEPAFAPADAILACAGAAGN
ncbi:MAG: lysophospholipid acyltransferase family protein [Nevskiales bacterium]